LAGFIAQLGILNIERIFEKRLARGPRLPDNRQAGRSAAGLSFFLSNPTRVQRNTMNVFQKIGIKIADFAKWFAGAVKSVVGLAARIESILRSEKPLEKPFISGLSTVILDVEALLAASEGAISADGLNFPADSKVYAGFVTLVDDFRKLAPVVEEAIALLEGKQLNPSAS
jgi:hypothetical protein